MTLRRLVPAALIALVLPALPAADPTYVWWEAESPVATNFPTIDSGSERGAELLSGGKWIGVGATTYPASPMFLEYTVSVPAAGSWELLTRKFWKHGAFRWRFDDGAWREVNRDNTTLLDRVELKPKLTACWVPLAVVDLAPGEHRLRIELTEPGGNAFFDAFVLTKEPFVPRGRDKPDAAWTPAPDGWFNFLPTNDATGSNAISLRDLNEKVAGEGGFIQAKDGRFVHGATGQAVPFWAVNAGPAVIDMPKPYVDRLARFLADRGVNLVRLHGPIHQGKGPQALEVDQARLDNVFYFVEALKRQGIYSHFSIHFQHWLSLAEVEAYKPYKTNPYVLHFFNDGYQESMKAWWKALLTTPSPYGGKPLVEDPAVMGAELINEDSFFFMSWQYGNINGAQRRMLEGLWHAWLAQRYGSLAAAKEAWGPVVLPEDEKALEQCAVMSAYHLRFSAKKPYTKRHYDSAEFLAGLQTGFYEEMNTYLKKDLGFRGMVCSSNWKTADEVHLGPVEKLTNLSTDFMDYHGYFGAPNIAKINPAVLASGDIRADRSMLRLDPGKTKAKEHGQAKLLGTASFDPSFIGMEYNGQPAMVSEYTWMGLNRFRGEMPIVSAAMFAQSGTDAPVCFALSSFPGWNMAVDGLWPLQTPSDMGQFPAAALLFRRGYVQETAPAAHITLNQADVMALKGTPVVTANIQDVNRSNEGKKGESTEVEEVDGKLFAIGKVRTDIVTDRPTSHVIEDLAKWDDPKAKILTGMGSQTFWDYGNGVYEVRTPQAQTVTGFLGKRPTTDLGDVVVTCRNEFASIAVVSMDGQPLATATRILVQVFTEQRNTGFEEKANELGQEIVAIGGAPLQVRAFTGSVAFKRPDAARLRVQAVSPDGAVLSTATGAATITLQPTTLYYLVTGP